MPVDGDIVLKAGLDTSNVSKQINQLQKSVSRGFKNLIRITFGVRSVFALIRKMRSALLEGFGELAKVHEPFNKAVSELMTSLELLRNTFAASFAPLVEVVAPILASFINLISRAVAAVGQFIAALTGKEYVSAKSKQIDYAQSVDKSTKSAKKNTDATKKQNEEAKKLQKTLAKFDDINILKEDKEKEEEEEPEVSPDLKFAVTPISDAFDSFALNFKAMWNQFKAAWEQEGEKTIRAIKDAFNSVISLAKTIGNTFKEVFTSQYGFNWLVSLLQLLQSIFGIISAIASVFEKAWNDNNRGYNYIASIFTALTSINNLLRDIGKAFIEAWNGGSGYALVSSFLRLLTNINLMIASIADAFRNAWNDNGTGVALIQSFLDMLTSILDLLADIAESVATAFQSQEAHNAIQNFLTLWTTIFNIINSIATALRNAWNDGGRGTTYVTSILLALGNWFSLLQTIGESFKRVWENNRGEEICANILEILTNMNTTLALSFATLQKGWESSGDRIWNAILKIVNDVLTAINDISQTTRDWMANLDYTPLFNAFATLLEKIEPVVNIIMNGLRKANDEVLLPLGKWTIEKALPPLLEAFGSALDVVRAAIDALSPILTPLWNSVIKPFGERIGGLVVALLEKLTSALTGLSNWITNNKEDFQLIVEVVGAFITTWMGASLIIGIINGVHTAINGVVAGFTAFITGSGPLILIIGAIIAIGIILYQNWDTICEYAAKLKDAIVGFFETIKEKVTTAFESAVELGKSIVDGIKKGITDFFDNCTNWIKTNIVDKFMTGIRSMFGLVEGGAGKLFNVGKDLITGLKNGIKDRITGIVEWIKTTIVTPFINGVKEAFGLNGDEPAIFKVGKSLIKKFKNGLKEMMKDVSSWVKSIIVDPFVDGINKLFGLDGEESVLYEIGKNLIAGLKDGILNAMTGIGDWVGDHVTGPICNGVKSLLGIHSPSTVFAGYGENIMEGLKNGVEDNEDLPKKALSNANSLMQNVFGAVQQLLAWSKVGSNIIKLGLIAGITLQTPSLILAITNLEKDMRKEIKNHYDAWTSVAKLMLTQFNKGLTEKKSTLITTINTIATSMKSKIDSYKTKFNSSGKNLMTELKRGIESGKPTVSKGIETLLTSIITTINSFKSKFKTAGSALATEIKSGIASKQSEVTSKAASLATDVYNEVKNKDWKSLGTAVCAGFVDGINGGSGWVHTWASWIGSNVYNDANGQNWKSLGHNVCAGFVDGISNGSGWVEVWARWLGNNVASAARSALGIYSPSRVFAEIGDMVTQGLGNGIRNNADNAVSAVEDLSSAITDEAEKTNPAITLSTSVDNWINSLDFILTKFSDSVINKFDNMITALEKLATLSSFNIPDIVNGKVVPSSSRTSGVVGSNMSQLVDNINSLLNERISPDELRSILADVISNYMDISFYLGDEQIARHANTGNLKLQRRYSTI